MAECFLCGKALARGEGIRAEVVTGYTSSSRGGSTQYAMRICCVPCLEARQRLEARGNRMVWSAIGCFSVGLIIAGSVFLLSLFSAVKEPKPSVRQPVTVIQPRSVQPAPPVTPLEPTTPVINQVIEAKSTTTDSTETRPSVTPDSRPIPPVSPVSPVVSEKAI